MKKLTAAFFILSSFLSVGQDVHFSQMGYSPLTLNPALSGAHSPLQAIVNYRSQWRSVNSPFSTIGASVDGRFNQNNKDVGIFAGGINFFNDQSGTQKINTTNVNLHLAYHLMINDENKIGIGIYGGWGQRSINLSDDRWGTQYDGTMDDGYNSSLAGGSSILDRNSFSYFDAGAGLTYSFSNQEGMMRQTKPRVHTTGIAFYHVSSPQIQFSSVYTENLYMRWSIFYNGIIGLSNEKGAIEPAIYFNRQGTSMEILYGLYYRHQVNDGSYYTGRNKPFYLHFGLFHRWADALVAKAMMEWNEMSLGFAYDVNISSLTTASNAKGGFELFLRYNMFPSTTYRTKIR